MKQGINEYLRDVGKSLSSPVATQLLQFGTRAKVRGQSMLRDSEGMISTKSNVLDIAQNFFAATQGRDELKEKFANFSSAMDAPSTGQEAVSGIKTVGAIDVTILSLSTSIIPFIAIDRALSTPTATVYYNELVALNSNGGVNQGQVVNGNFTPPNTRVNISTEKTASITSGTPHAANAKIVPGTVVIKFTKNSVDYAGKDYAQNGAIMFDPTSGVTAASVDYDTGNITFTCGEGQTATLEYQVDVPAENDKNNGALVVAPKWTPVTLNTTRDNIIVQDNLVNRMAMAKVQMIATSGAGGTSQADVLMARTKNTYIEALNVKVLKACVSKYTKYEQASIRLDLSQYDVGKWATTKNDQILQLITNLDANFLASTGIQATAIITSSYGVSLLQCIPNMWTPNPDAQMGLNGLAGYFNGKAVYRHNYINSMTFTEDGYSGNANIIMIPFFAVAKLPDNNSGSTVFGEYLPLTSTGVVGNFNNPQNISTGFFSQTGVTVIDGNLIKMAAVLPPSSGLYGDLPAGQ